MKIALDHGVQGHLIKACTAHEVVVAGLAGPAGDGRAGPPERVLTVSAILSPQRLIETWAAGVDLPALEPAMDLAPEVLLLGTGARLRWPGGAVAAALNARRIGFEVMDTTTACRTYNVLALEGRRVVAALAIGVQL